MRGILLFMVSVTVFSTSIAQNTGIQFEQTKKWEQVTDKAKKEKRLIFVDCYTDWCGPCYTMAHTVFVQDTVGDFFNRHFVNAKFEMEKDTDGKMLKTKYGIEAYPTFLFIDPETQEEVMRVLGGRTVDAMLYYAAIALDPRENTAGLAKRYAAGERGFDFLKQYYSRLEDSSLPCKEKIAHDFLNSADLAQLLTQEGWRIFARYINDPLAKPFRLVMTNREKFYAGIGQEIVDYKLENVIENAVEEITLRNSDKGDFDHTRNTELIQYLKTIDSPIVPGALANLYAARFVRVGNYADLVRNMQDVLKYNLLRGNGEKKYFDKYIQVFENCTDNSLVRDVIRLLGEKCEQTTTFYGKADLMKLKATLQTKLGDLSGAVQSKKQEAEFRAEGDDAGEWMD